MVHYGERFFTSLGFAPLPQTFWERSLFVKPRGPRRGVPCQRLGHRHHGRSACEVVHRDERRGLYHDPPRARPQFYHRAYKDQPFLFRDSANDGFHEAIGDTIALSVTPEYLVKIGLLKQAPDPSKDIGLLLYKALEKIAFLPFGLLIDKWRWEVFSGQITPEHYNEAWWKLRLQYQGIAPPVPRSEADFDPGAKYHVAANYPYTRVLPGGHSAVPVSSRAGEGRGVHGPAESLLHLRQQGSGTPSERHAGRWAQAVLGRMRWLN